MSADRHLLHQALDTLDDVFYVYDERGELAVWNDRLSQLFDLTDEELSGMLPMDFFVESDRPAVEQALADVLERGEAVVEARAETEEGTILFELTANRLTDDDGDVIGFCGIGRDVTANREQERLLAAQNERLNSFANVLAHDIRNPLNVAMGFLELADTEATEIGHVAAALERIERIVDDVLVLAVEGQPAAADSIDLATVVHEAWRTVDTTDATLDVRTDRVVKGDRSRLQRLFENLFRNSVEHGAASRKTPSVTVTVVVEDTPTGFAVTDDGPGIDPANAEHVFETGVTTNLGGTGFGLAIVRAAAEAHGWTVTLADTDRGARFEFDIVPDAEVELSSSTE